MSGFSKLESLMDSLLSSTRVSTFLRFASLGQGSPNAFLSSTAGSTASTTGNFTAVQILSSTATITSITIDGAVSTALSSISLNQGIIIYGQITSITIGSTTANTVRLYGGINTSL
jgi:hypothetical protein